MFEFQTTDLQTEAEIPLVFLTRLSVPPGGTGV